MKKIVLAIINDILVSKNLPAVAELNPEMKLREDLGLTSFDLAELTVKIEDKFDIDIFEDGIVSKIGEVFEKLS